MTQAVDTLSLVLQNICELRYHFSTMMVRAWPNTLLALSVRNDTYANTDMKLGFSRGDVELAGVAGAHSPTLFTPHPIFHPKNVHR